MDPLSQLAEVLHDGWREHMRQLGYTLGSRDEAKMTHPHLIPWATKTEEEKNQDRYQAAVIIRKWYHEGLAEDQIPKLIHDSWRDWMKLTGKSGTKPHDKPYEEAHADGPRDHGTQAPFVWKYLQKLP